MAGKQEEREEFSRAQKVLAEELKNGEFRPLYLLYGEEQYLHSYYKKLFLKAFSENEGINITLVEDITDSKALKEIAETLPFFAPYRLLVFDGRLSGRKKLDENFVQYLETSPESTVMLFLEEKVDRRSAFYKTIKKRGLILPCVEQDNIFLQKFALRILKKEDKLISPSLMQELLQRTGTNMFRIETECRKLASYLGEEKEVTAESIELCLKKLPEDRVFELIEAIGRGDRERLFRYYGDLLQLEESPTKIRLLIKSNVEKLLLVREKLTEGRSEREMTGELSMEPWRVKKYTAEARHYTLEALRDFFHSLLRLEEEIRQGKIEDRLALEILLSGEEKAFFA